MYKQIMKRYKNLYPQICSLENIKTAHKNAQKGKKHYPGIIKVNRYESEYLQKLQDMLLKEEFQTSEYKVYLKKGQKKDRWIYKLPYFPDRIVHHCIVQILEPIWKNLFIRDTYSAIRGRGIHDGVNRIHNALQDTKNTKFCLKLDIHKFYPSINHSIMSDILTKKIKCIKTMRLLNEIIASSYSGVPIGNYLSQYFGNLYLTYFDHWVKEVLGIKYYFRYCDDLVIMSHNKKELYKVREEIQKYLYDNLSLHIKENYKIFPTRQCGLDFLGYVFLGNHTRIRKDIVNNFKAKVRNIKKNYKNMSVSKILNTIMSYYGWFLYANAHNLWVEYIDKEMEAIVDYVCKCNNLKNPLRRILC